MVYLYNFMLSGEVIEEYTSATMLCARLIVTVCQPGVVVSANAETAALSGRYEAT